MATLSMIQVARYAYAAGFRGQDLRTIVAISQAESGFNPQAHNPGGPGDPENSYGLWQINLVAHHDITAQQAMDPQQAANYAYKLFIHDGGFTDWSTYTSGAYKQQPSWIMMEGYLVFGSATGGLGGTPFTGWSPQRALEIWPWLTTDGMTPNINNPYHSQFEASRGGVQDGVGISVPTVDTPISSLTAGTVVAAAFGQDLAPPGQNWNYGGFIIVKSTIPGIGICDVFYRHMDTLSVQKNDSVGVGQVLGLSGGQTQGGHHPESPVFSTGPHIDVGINPTTLPFTSIGPNVDPTQWLRSLVANGPSSHDVLATAFLGVRVVDQLVTGTGPVGDSFLAICADIDYGMGFIPIDWSTLGSGTSWWDYILPWQWPYAVSTVAGNLAGALFHDLAAFLFRCLVVLIGLVIIIAWFVALLRGFIRTETDGEAGQTAGAALSGAAETAVVA